MKKYVLGITGASGSVVGVRLLRELISHAEVHLIITSQAFSIIRHETGMDWHGGTDALVQKKIRRHFSTDRLFYWSEHNFASPPSSGSFQTDGMLVVPCSMKTLAGIAHGYANTLVERASDVTIKESRMLLISPRETPLSAIHLENMLKLARLGVRIVPPVMGFYHKPKDISEMVDFIVGKILDSAGLRHNLYKRWEGQSQIL